MELSAPVRPLLPADPDAELVAAAREDPHAFLALYEQYFDRVLGYVRLRLHDQATCEDVTSQTFTTALEQLARFRGDGPFAAWLFRIARNAVNDVGRRPRLVPLPEELDPADDAELDQALLERERSRRLRALVAELEPERQHLLALRYGAELSYEQIAAILDVAPGTLRVRLHRLLDDLRRRYPDDE
jgi:RNA polymerase sigma-70 factor (ECF subfamily)